MMYSDSENAARCIGILKDAVGTADTERFISYIVKESSDYTLWRRRIFDDMTLEEVLDNAAEYAREHPLPEETRERVEAYKKKHPHSDRSDTRLGSEPQPWLL
jgi:hypothetical protein